MTRFEQRNDGTCRFCGKPVVWATDEKGTQQILDPKPPVFLVDVEGQRCERANGPGYAMGADIGGGFTKEGTHLVSHWSTCPKAAEVQRMLLGPGRKP